MPSTSRPAALVRDQENGGSAEPSGSLCLIGETCSVSQAPTVSLLRVWQRWRLPGPTQTHSVAAKQFSGTAKYFPCTLVSVAEITVEKGTLPQTRIPITPQEFQTKNSRKASEFLRHWIIGLLGLCCLSLSPGAKAAAPIASDDFTLASEDGLGGLVALSAVLFGNSVAISCVAISWPQSAAGFNLEVTDNLATPKWTAVSTAPVAVGNNNTVTVPLSGGARFYRLKK